MTFPQTVPAEANQVMETVRISWIKNGRWSKIENYVADRRVYTDAWKKAKNVCSKKMFEEIGQEIETRK